MSAGGMFKSFIGGEITEDEFYEQSKPLYKIMIETVIKQKVRLGGSFCYCSCSSSTENKRIHVPSGWTRFNLHLAEPVKGMSGSTTKAETW